MEEEKFKEMEKAMDKILEAFGVTEETRTAIGELQEELRNETRPVVIEEKKAKLQEDQAKQEEFNEMTVNALINMKKDILTARKQIQLNYQQELLNLQDHQQELEKQKDELKEKRIEAAERISKMALKADAEDKTEIFDSIQNNTEKVLGKLDNQVEEIDKELAKNQESLDEYKNKYLENISKLDEWETTITQFARRLDVLEELDAVKIDDVTTQSKDDSKGNEFDDGKTSFNRSTPSMEDDGNNTIAAEDSTPEENKEQKENNKNNGPLTSEELEDIINSLNDTPKKNPRKKGESLQEMVDRLGIITKDKDKYTEIQIFEGYILKPDDKSKTAEELAIEQYEKETGKKFNRETQEIRWDGADGAPGFDDGPQVKFEVIEKIKIEEQNQGENKRGIPDQDPKPDPDQDPNRFGIVRDDGQDPDQDQDQKPDKDPNKYGIVRDNGQAPDQDPKPDPKPTRTIPRQIPQDGKKALVVDSGLQVLNDIFQGKYDFEEQGIAMPEIKARHTLSDNPIWQALPGAAGVAGIVTGLWPVAIAGAAGAFLVKPILRKITGEKGTIKKIENVLTNLENTDPERFELLEDYLTEEQIVGLTPNGVFLEAMHNVLKRRAADIERSNNERLKEIEPIILDPKTSESIKATLEKERNELIKETEEAKSRVKRVRRGKVDTSHADRDNVKGGFFSLRNPTTKQYKEPLNQAALKEREMLIAEKEGDIDREVESRREFEDFLLEKSKTKGAKRKVFNFKRGEVGIGSDLISDRKDNRVRNASYIAVGLAATIKTLEELLRLQEEQHLASDVANANYMKIQQAQQDLENYKNNLQSGVNVSDTQVKNALSEEVLQRANAAEVAAMRINGGLKEASQAYYDADDALNIDVENGVQTVENITDTIKNFGGVDKLLETVRQLLYMKAQGLSTEQALVTASNPSLMASWDVNHAVQASLLQGTANGEFGQSEIDLLQQLLDMATKANNVPTIASGNLAVKTFANLKTAIVGGVLPIIRAIKDHEKKDKIKGAKSKKKDKNVKVKEDEDKGIEIE